MRALLLATFALCPAVAFGQPYPEAKDGKQVFAVTLSPMAAPKPLSHFYLTPQYHEQQPGDQLSGFMKCFMEQRAFYSAEQEKLREKLNELPLADLPKDSRQQASVLAGTAYPEKYRGMMANMDLAARYTRTEWNDYFRVREDGINWLLPEVQYMRHLANVLKVRLRGEIKNGEFERAVVTVRTMTGLARMFESHPSIIGGLVGIAVQSIAWNGVEEMIAQPGCPNLFWSLVELPNPPFNIAKGFEGERMFLSTSLDYLLTLDRPATDADFAKVFDFLEELNKSEGLGGKDGVQLLSLRTRAGMLAADLKHVEEARARLVGVGRMKPAAVNAFGPMQVTLTDDVLSYQVLRDEFMKYRNLPYAESQAGMAEMEKVLKGQKDQLIVAPILLPALSKVKAAEVRTAQRVAYLMDGEYFVLRTQIG